MDTKFFVAFPVSGLHLLSIVSVDGDITENMGWCIGSSSSEINRGRLLSAMVTWATADHLPWLNVRRTGCHLWIPWTTSELGMAWSRIVCSDRCPFMPCYFGLSRRICGLERLGTWRGQKGQAKSIDRQCGTGSCVTGRRAPTSNLMCEPRGIGLLRYIYWSILVYTPWAIKKRATFIFMITLANVDRFQ